ncbi:MAG: T9SS type A sorting domain-containing protein, partial [Bacteroidales bacterium]
SKAKVAPKTKPKPMAGSTTGSMAGSSMAGSPMAGPMKNSPKAIPFCDPLSLEISIGDFPSGMYIVEVQTAQGLFSTKIFKK